MQLKKTLRWAFDNAGRLAGPLRARRQYAVTTPPFMKTQRVVNTSTGAARRYEMRDPVDIEVLYQTFCEEQYRFERLATWPAIRARYEAIRAAGRTPFILDCGANIGLSAAYFRDRFPEAKVVGIEPEPGNVALARRNCPDAEFIEAAISANPGRGSIHDPGAGGWAIRVEKSAEGTVPFISVDEVLAMHPDCEPFIAKIDIEGFESDLFSANTGWIDRFVLLVVELHDWMLPGQGTAASFLQAVAQRPRDFVFFGENVFSIAHRA